MPNSREYLEWRFAVSLGYRSAEEMHEHQRAQSQVHRYPTRPVRPPVRTRRQTNPLYLIVAILIGGLIVLWSTGAFGAPAASPAPEPFAVGTRQQIMRALNPLDEFALDPRVLYYDETEFPPAYQFDHLGRVSFHAVRYNISANGAEPYGNGNREFPWAKTGGLDKVPPGTAAAYKFIRLPAQPIIWWRDRGNWVHWRFPQGTTVGEVLAMRCADGQWRPFEVRLRTRGATAWHIDLLKPYPTTADLVAGIRWLRPNWAQNPGLAATIRELSAATLEPTELRDRHPRPALRPQARSRHVLPDFGSDLACELLERAEFTHATGDTWSGSDCFAPTAREASIVPAGYQGHLLGSDDQACANCHESTHRDVDEFDARRDWYGLIRGDDGIFSFHPAEPDCISDNGYPRRVRIRDMPGVLEARDDQRHDPSDYQELLP
ncbi:MAG: hypothetical protein AB7U73_01185 [Pirellulales bacterium]